MNLCQSTSAQVCWKTITFQLFRSNNHRAEVLISIETQVLRALFTAQSGHVKARRIKRRPAADASSGLLVG
ncbi:hypothetical protein WN51_01251 [Melipona quadrifasciata]|uniref:Uncharacterized protein n=1 Tax=Melipona quadrifasciata TaxID=166423 RepID=A0A0M8ZYI4_9HYME|nr:hypothetical protein WN51_01251 [Melipona quadrifasciata]